MSIELIKEKLDTVNNQGVIISRKQIGYFNNFYDPIEGIGNLKYHYSPNELILLAPEETITELDGIAGYDFSIDSAQLYVKTEDFALMVITDTEDIQFFKEVCVNVLNNEEINEEGSYL